MPNPEEFVVAAKLGAEVIDQAAPQVFAKLPGLVELSGKAGSVAPGFVSMLEPETRALIETAAGRTGNPLGTLLFGAAERTGVPLSVDTGRIAAIRESLIGGQTTEIDSALRSAFTPRTYAEKMAFYGG